MFMLTSRTTEIKVESTTVEQQVVFETYRTQRGWNFVFLILTYPSELSISTYGISIHAKNILHCLNHRTHNALFVDPSFISIIAREETDSNQIFSS